MQLYGTFASSAALRASKAAAVLMLFTRQSTKCMSLEAVTQANHQRNTSTGCMRYQPGARERLEVRRSPDNASSQPCHVS
jgi:hypothetical protein